MFFALSAFFTSIEHFAAAAVRDKAEQARTNLFDVNIS